MMHLMKTISFNILQIMNIGWDTRHFSVSHTVQTAFETVGDAWIVQIGSSFDMANVQGILY